MEVVFPLSTVISSLFSRYEPDLFTLTFGHPSTFPTCHKRKLLLNSYSNEWGWWWFLKWMFSKTIYLSSYLATSVLNFEMYVNTGEWWQLSVLHPKHSDETVQFIVTCTVMTSRAVPSQIFTLKNNKVDTLIDFCIRNIVFLTLCMPPYSETL